MMQIVEWSFDKVVVVLLFVKFAEEHNLMMVLDIVGTYLLVEMIDFDFAYCCFVG